MDTEIAIAATAIVHTMDHMFTTARTTTTRHYYPPYPYYYAPAPYYGSSVSFSFGF